MVQRPDRYSFFRKDRSGKFLIARGSGLSYAAASFGPDAVTVDLCSFNRILAYADDTGIVHVEAGMRLDALFDFLAAHRRYLPVQPGHGAISVGGCIAADVHGKNQARDGTFIRHVDSIRLFHPSHGFVELSLTQNADVFRATCGGYGTTGIIVSARLRSAPLPANSTELRSTKVGSISEAAAVLKNAAKDSDFVYSWHDFLGSGPDFGRGFVLAGRFVLQSQEPPMPDKLSRVRNLSAAWRANVPFRVLNPWTCKLANALYSAKLKYLRLNSLSLEQSLFPIHGTENYYRAFGKTGFHEYQAVIPHDRFGDYIAGLRAAMERRKVIVTLASAKIFAGASDLVRFTGDGICFAVNVRRCSAASKFLQDLDHLVVEVAGRPNIIKDSRLPRSVFEASYPDVSRFRSIVLGWDPARLFRSELSQRLGL